MKCLFSLSFSALLTLAYSQNTPPISTASMMANSAKIIIDHCADQDASMPTLNRIIVQPNFSDQELEFLQKLPLPERDILTEATFIDNNNFTYPYEIKIDYPDQGFFVIGFTKYPNFSSSVWLNEATQVEKKLCEEDFLGILGAKTSPFSRLLSGDIDTLRMGFYKKEFGSPKTQWIFSKSETDDALIIKKLTYTKKGLQEKKVSIEVIEATQFDKLLTIEQNLRQNIIESHQADLKKRESISITDGEFTWRLNLTGKKNQFYDQLVQLFK
jgi:hypothetical protein